MNELLAIIIIVLVCCAMFFAWLLSMATCPDKMVNLISGPSQHTSSSSGSSSVSKELISPTKFNEKDDQDGSKGSRASSTVSTVSSFLHRLNSQRGSNNSKKLSVVPEQDEQLTVTSISQVLRQGRQPCSPSGQDKKTECRLPWAYTPSTKPGIIMEEEPNHPRRVTSINMEEPKQDEETSQERCVEDVIDRRNRRLKDREEQKRRREDSSLSLASDLDGNGPQQPMTAEVTPVPSRCTSHPGSLANENNPEEVQPLLQQQHTEEVVSTTREDESVLSQRSSAPAIIHVV